MLAMGTGGITCSIVGTCFDTITGERTVFDGIKVGYEWWRGRQRGKKEGGG